MDRGKVDAYELDDDPVRILEPQDCLSEFSRRSLTRDARLDHPPHPFANAVLWNGKRNLTDLAMPDPTGCTILPDEERDD